MEKTIILKVDRPMPRGIGPTPVSTRSLPSGMAESVSAADERSLETLAGMTVEMAELSENEQADLDRDPNVAGRGKPMPLKLISPVEEASDFPAANSTGDGTGDGNPTWGVTATGAAASDYSGRGAKVAVLDTGIDRHHEAFGRLQITEGGNYVDFTGEGYEDRNGHGTHCAGTIFGGHVDGTRIGVAPGVDDVLIGKVLGENGGDTAALISAMQWAIEHKANVISMSLGYDFPGLVAYLVESRGYAVDLATAHALVRFKDNLDLFNATMSHIEAIARLSGASTGFGKGAIVVAASGNESRVGQNPQHRLPASLPSASNGVMSVGALQQHTADRFRVADFSNGAVTVAAPGVGVVSAKTGGGLTSLSGTSMATPHVAGLMALWFQQQESEGETKIVDRVTAQIVANADPSRIESSTQSDFGAGLVRAP
ncbi:MAG: S8 family serine peptidase [Alteripontixanthobacter sp.]